MLKKNHEFFIKMLVDIRDNMDISMIIRNAYEQARIFSEPFDYIADSTPKEEAPILLQKFEALLKTIQDIHKLNLHSVASIDHYVNNAADQFLPWLSKKDPDLFLQTFDKPYFTDETTSPNIKTDVSEVVHGIIVRLIPQSKKMAQNNNTR